MKNQSYIYFHINPLTNKVFYVGKGTGDRAWKKSGRNNYWINTVNKYGYIVDIVEDNLTEDISFQREKFYINKIGRNNLVNLTDGGEGASGCSYIKSKEHKENLSKANKGKKHTKEIIKKISENNGRSVKIKYNDIIYNSIMDLYIKQFNYLSQAGFYRLVKNSKIDNLIII
jgi:hypothetical protein